MSTLSFLLLLACPRRAPEPLELPEEVSGDVVELNEEPSAWRVVNGPWTDQETGLHVDVLEGWSGQPGEANAPLRIRLDHVSSGARLEIRVYPENGLVPRERVGCAWSYVEEGSYSTLRVTGEVRVASCLPDDPGAPRVLATRARQDERDWHFELLVPQGYLAPSKTAADELMATIRFGS